MRCLATALLALGFLRLAQAGPEPLSLSASWAIKEVGVVRKLDDPQRLDTPQFYLNVSLVGSDAWKSQGLDEDEVHALSWWMVIRAMHVPGPYLLADAKPIYPSDWVFGGNMATFYFPLPPTRPANMELHILAPTIAVERFTTKVPLAPEGSAAFEFAGM